MEVETALEYSGCDHNVFEPPHSVNIIHNAVVRIGVCSNDDMVGHDA